MPIQVTCPGCLARFTVSDKYAGKTGPCPKCKKVIVVPDKSQEVVIHAPESSGPKDSKGVAVLKPIRRKEFRVGVKTWAATFIGALSVVAIAISFRYSNAPPPIWLLALGAIAIAPPIVMLGYTFFRDDELEGYSGKEYLARTAICSVVFAFTWLLYYLLAPYLNDSKSLAEVPSSIMAVMMIGMLAIGTGASLATLELETGQSVLQYMSYFAVCFFLCMIMGVELGEPLAKPKLKKKPAVTQPMAIQGNATQKPSVPPVIQTPPAKAANPPTKAPAK